MSHSRARSMRWWLATLAIGVALPAFLLLIWICVVQVRREQMEAKRAALGVARSTAARIRELQAESVALLSVMAARPEIADPAACRTAAAIVDYLPRYADILLFDRSGALICSGNSLAENERVSSLARPWIQSEVRSGHLRAGTPVARTFDKRSILIRAMPVRGGHGTVVLLELMDRVTRAALIPDAVVTILDRDGWVIARSTASETWSGRNVRGTRIAELAARSDEGIAESEGLDGVSKLYGFTRIPELGWTIYAGVPTAAIVGPVRETFINGAIGTIGIIVIVAVITIVLSRRIGGPIHDLVSAAETTEADAYDKVADAKGPLEIATLASAFNQMVHRRQEADERMRSGEQKLKALSDRLLTVQEEERTRIARELHDDLGQSLTALKMDVGGLLSASSVTSDPLRDRITATLDELMTAVQRISSELRPSILDDLGLAAAIEAEASQFEQRTGIECELSLPEHDGVQVSGPVLTAIYRIVQEALTNVARHANASRVEVRLRQRLEELLLEVRDDGCGISDEEIGNPLSLGLIGIRERADLAGGTVHFEGVAGRGTIVSVRFPTHS